MEQSTERTSRTSLPFKTFESALLSTQPLQNSIFKSCCFHHAQKFAKRLFKSFVSLLWYLWFNTFEWNSWQICILGIPCTVHESPCEYALRELRKEGKTFVLSTPLFIPCGTPRKLWVLCCYTVECRTNTSSFPKYGA